MPEISRFFGISIAMFFTDHPPPHFHVRYGDQKAMINIETLTVIGGKLSPRTLNLVLEWARMHQSELLQDWHLAQEPTDLKPIAPLE
jgi:hypothetical protein